MLAVRLLCWKDLSAIGINGEIKLNESENKLIRPGKVKGMSRKSKGPYSVVRDGPHDLKLHF